MSSLRRDLQQAGPQWYCLRTQPKREHVAAAMVRNTLGIDVYCPRISQVRKTRTGKRRFVEALFPGYLFACFNLVSTYRGVIHTKGVQYVVHKGDEPVPVEGEVINRMRGNYPEDGIFVVPDPSLDSGTTVDLVAGSLQGLSGTVLAQMPAENRIEVLLEFLGREVVVALHSDDILIRRG